MWVSHWNSLNLFLKKSVLMLKFVAYVWYDQQVSSLWHRFFILMVFPRKFAIFTLCWKIWRRTRAPIWLLFAARCTEIRFFCGNASVENYPIHWRIIALFVSTKLSKSKSKKTKHRLLHFFRNSFRRRFLRNTLQLVIGRKAIVFACKQINNRG